MHDRSNDWWRYDRWRHDDLRSIIDDWWFKHSHWLLNHEGMSVLHSNRRGDHHSWLLNNKGRLLNDQGWFFNDDSWMLFNDDGRAHWTGWMDKSGMVFWFILKVT